MSDVVFEDEERLRRSTSSGGTLQASSIVRFLIRKKIASTAQQATVFAWVAIIAMFLGSFYFADKANIIHTGISDTNAVVPMTPDEAELLYKAQ